MGSGFSRCFNAGAPLDEYEMELFEQAVMWREREKRLQQAEIAENEQKWRKWITVSSLLLKFFAMSMPMP